MFSKQPYLHSLVDRMMEEISREFLCDALCLWICKNDKESLQIKRLAVERLEERGLKKVQLQSYLCFVSKVISNTKMTFFISQKSRY